MERKIFNHYLDILDYDNKPEFLDKYLEIPCLQRLKKVGYFCGMDYASKNIYEFPEKISRYDHSLTVALITWKLTKNREATLAGLFHDISTPCFSHVIDYMNKDYTNQESTEEKTEEILRSDKDLCCCLSCDGISIDDIVDFKKYSVVDLDRPMLCADRIDGVILTGLFWTKNINIDDVRKFILDLQVLRNEFNVLEVGFHSEDVANLVLETSELIDVYCHSKEDNYMMELLASITKRSIDVGIITYDDLFILNEEELMDKISSSNDISILVSLDKFRNITIDDIPYMEIPQVKVRDLNPLVLSRRLKLR